jgi:hypothetical protein
MKRSAKIGLVVMGALGVTGASAYWLNNQCEARAPSNPQSTSDQGCRRPLWSHSSYGHGSSPAAKPSSPTGGTAERGGFGGIGSRGGG